MRTSRTIETSPNAAVRRPLESFRCLSLGTSLQIPGSGPVRTRVRKRQVAWPYIDNATQFHYQQSAVGKLPGLRLRTLLALGLCAACTVGLSRSARAQDGERLAQATEGGAPTDAAPPALHPPQLVDFVEAEYPFAALGERREARVVLRLTIDAEGRVTEAAVIEPAGHGFDEATQSAALRFRFAPARRGEAPVAARILYAYEFRLPSPSPSPSPQAAAAGRAPGVGQLEPPLAVSTGQTAQPTVRLPPEAERAPFEVVVRGRTEAERLRHSAQAVHVVETEQAQRQTADLGEVLARSQGVGVRRGGGLGSGTRFSLNGLTDDQIRFFLDGIPLPFSGYPFGIANVPVNLVERVEVYRGVVPIRFGADALGGAVNLVTDDHVRGTHGSASYQVGSFGTQRLSLGLRHLHEPSGFLTRVAAFFDYADNDYPIDVEMPDERGRLSPARVYRFHDAYRAAGANAEVGLVDRPWGKRLLLRAFITDYDKELQNNVVMTVPYGEVEYGELATGASLRYENTFARRLTVEAVGGYAYTATKFLDVAECVYDWFGRCIRDRRVPGELEAQARDQVLWEHNAYGRIDLAWRVHPQHTARLSLAPTYTTRTGDERHQVDPAARDPLTRERDLMTLVSGLEYELDLFDDRLENMAFVKDYLQQARSEEPLPGGILRARDRDTHRFGVGNALRYRFFDWLYSKASYEWSTRLPRADEVFGDGMLVIANLELEPETSHNVNVGLTVDARETSAGALRADVSGFLREADQLIVLLGNDRLFSYQNVFGARSLGVEGALGWTSPGEYVALEGNISYLDFRNTSSEGTFGDFEGDRIPNRPYLFSNASARLKLRNVAAENDELALTWHTRYVHEFFRGWESVGLRQFKQVVPSQLLHSLALTHLVKGDPMALSFTGELQNITDQPAFDFFGVQRPGRSFYFKTTAEF
jgi:vitamin B12 transporter